ncbi:MAG TPA: hypothetical protein VK095_06360, partial [Beutenbergiaceae bacterium]|nr:hypothetical protein [Beutenbergiaceae bacterium]
MPPSVNARKRGRHRGPRRSRGVLLPATLMALVLILATGGVALAWIGGEGGATETDPPAQSPDPEPDPAPTEPDPEPAADAVFTIGAVGDVLPHDTVLGTARTGDSY